MKLLAIPGSLSDTSSNRLLLRHVRDAATPPDEVVLFDALDDIPHFSPERERHTAPVAVVALREAVRATDAVLISTPEYAGGMPGSLKNALDWLVGSGEMYGRDVVVVSAAPSEERGHNARAWVEQTLGMQGAHVRDSFSVAVPRDASAGALAATAARVLARTRGAVAGHD